MSKEQQSRLKKEATELVKKTENTKKEENDTKEEEIRRLQSRLIIFTQYHNNEPDEDLQAKRRAMDLAIDKNVPLLDRLSIYNLLHEDRLSGYANGFFPASWNKKENEELKNKREELRTDPTQLKHILFEVAMEYPRTALRNYPEYKDESYAHDVVRVAIHYALETRPGEIMDHYTFIREIEGQEKAREITNKAFEVAVKLNPEKSLKKWPGLADVVGTIDKNLVVKAAEILCVRDPKSAVRILEYEYRGDDAMKEYLETAHKLLALREGMKDDREFGEKIKNFQEEISTMFPAVKAGLERYNKYGGLTLECVNLNKNANEIVIINTFGSYHDEPFLIRLNIEEVMLYVEGIDESEERTMQVERLIQREVDKEYKKNKDQIEIWRRARDPEGMLTNGHKTGVLIVTAPGHLNGGIEKDAVWWTEYLHRKGVPISNMQFLMERDVEWEEATKLTKLRLPKAVKVSTKGKILEYYEQGIREAIARGDREFVFFYMLHGADNGTAQGAGKVDIAANEFSKILAKKDRKTGKALGELINVTEFAESCYSGSQLMKKKTYLKKNKVPIVNLRSIAVASGHQPGGAHLDPHSDSLREPLLHSNRMSELKKKGDNGLAVTHYLSYYDELATYLRNREAQRLKISPEQVKMGRVGTFTHAVQFADRMARDENQLGMYNQNPEGFHYSTEKPGTPEQPIIKKLTDAREQKQRDSEKFV